MSRLPDFEAVKALGVEERRTWLRGWMERMSLRNANQAAPVLAVSRQTVERMLYEGQHKRNLVTNQTLRIACLVEALRFERSPTPDVL